MIPALALLLFFSPWGNDLYALPKAVAVCAAVFGSFWRDSPAVWPMDMRPWMYLGAALLASTLFSWDLGYSLLSVDHARALGIFQWAVCALVFLYGCQAGREDVGRAVLWGGGFVAVYAIVQRLTLTGRASWGSTQGSPVLVGEMLAVCFPVAWAVHPALAGLFAAAAVAVQCRSAVLAMVVMSVYLWRKS